MNQPRPDLKLGDAPLWVEPPAAPAAADVWVYDQDGALIGKDKAPPDPRQPGRFLLPGNATTDAPPAPGAGQEAARVGGAWVLRAKLAKVEPDTPQATPGQLRASAINARLDAIDKASVRSLRESIAAQAKGQAVPAFAANKLATLETEAAALRLELAGIKP